MEGRIANLAARKSRPGQSVALNVVLVASLLAIVTVGLFSTLADRVGRRPVYAFGAVFMAVFASPFFWLAGSGSSAALWLVLIVGLAIGDASMYGAQTLLLFDARARY